MQKWKLPTKPKALNWFVSVNQSCSDANYFVYTQPLKMWFQLSSEFQAFFVVLSIGLATPFVSIVGARRYLAFFFFFFQLFYFFGGLFSIQFVRSVCLSVLLGRCRIVSIRLLRCRGGGADGDGVAHISILCEAMPNIDWMHNCVLQSIQAAKAFP